MVAGAALPISSSVLRMDADALNDFLAKAFPHLSEVKRGRVRSVEPGLLFAELETDVGNLRPGGLVSGPTQMGFADLLGYAMVLAHIGPVAMAVTSALNYQFLRPCPLGTLTGKTELLRLGRKLATMDVRIYGEDLTKPVGQANVTYAIP